MIFLFLRARMQSPFNLLMHIFCSIDLQTDRVFKEFLRESSPTSSSPSLLLGEPLPPPSHMVPPPPLKNTSSTQLRRQVMRKQYSDSIAMYYGQQQRRWRFTKQVMYIYKNPTVKLNDCIFFFMLISAICPITPHVSVDRLFAGKYSTDLSNSFLNHEYFTPFLNKS